MTLANDTVRRFQDFELNLAAHELLRRGHPVKLEGRAMSLLILLLERPGELVTRAEIMTRLWGSDAFIDVEAGINTAVRKLRRALRDSPFDPRTIKTVQGKGYRFIAPLDAAETRPDAPVAEARARPVLAAERRGRILRGAGVAVAALAMVVLGVGLAPSPPPPPRVQVQSLRVLEGGASAAALAGRLGDEISGVLNESGIQTSPPPWSFVGGFRRTPPDLVFGGLVSQKGDVLHARIDLMDAKAGLTLWSRQFNGRAGDEEALAVRTAAAATGSIQTALEAQHYQKGVRLDPTTLALQIRGVELWTNPPPLNLLAMREPFEQVVRRAPNFARGHGQLASVLAWEAASHPPGPEREALLQRAEAEARAAIRLDAATAGPAYSALGEISQHRAPGDRLAIERPFREGLRADPNYAYLNMRVCDLLLDAGRTGEAQFYCLRALALRPMSSRIGQRYAAVLEASGDSGAALAQIEKVVRYEPDNWVIRRAHTQIAVLAEPPAEASRTLHDPADAQLRMPWPPAAIAALDLFLKAKAGGSPADVQRATKALAAATDKGLDLGLALNALQQLGQTEAVFALLAHAPLEGISRYGRIDFLMHPALAPLRADDRFWTAANRLGLVRYWQTTRTWPDFCAATAPRIDCPALAARASGTRVAMR